MTRSVLQDWVMELPLREQGTLLTGVRGCDLTPKHHNGDGPERQLVAFLRWCYMVPADEREVDIPDAFFRSTPPDHWKPSMFGHYPQHWYSHLMHCFEVVGYRRWHDATCKGTRHRHEAYRHGADILEPVLLCATCAAWSIYERLATSLHLTPETREAMIERLSEDRIELGNVVS